MTSSPRRPGWTRPLTAALAVTALAVTVATAATAGPKAPPVELQLLSVSDWHAQLDPVSVTGVGDVGGAAVLSSYFDADRAANPNTLTFTAGDAFGASPPLSNFFNEVPAVEAMNLMGFDADTFGNHNFDRGVGHLQEMVDIAEFPYLSANLKNRDANLTGVKDYEIFETGGVKVAVIGVTNPEAPTLVFPGNFGTIEVTDPVVAAQKARSAAKKEGATVFVVLTHMGITGVDSATGLAFGPLIDFSNSLEGFDVVLGDHTDFQYTGVHAGALVVENRSKGLTYAKTSLTVNSHNGKVTASSVQFVTPLSSAVTPDPEIVSLLQPYRDELAPILGTVIGEATKAIPRSDACGRADGRLCESLIGNVVTDAMRLRYGTDFAMTNAGGLRDSLTCPTTTTTAFCPPYAGGNPQITRGKVIAVLPFGNVAVTGSITGAELKAMLEKSVEAMPGANGRFLQVSGLCFSYDISSAPGNRVTSVVRQAADGTCSGPAVDLAATVNYTMTQNDFMASGGEGYPNVVSKVVSREILDQVLEGHVASTSPLSPTIQGRIVCTSSGAVACPAVTAP